MCDKNGGNVKFYLKWYLDSAHQSYRFWHEEFQKEDRESCPVLNPSSVSRDGRPASRYMAGLCKGMMLAAEYTARDLENIIRNT